MQACHCSIQIMSNRSTVRYHVFVSVKFTNNIFNRSLITGTSSLLVPEEFGQVLAQGEVRCWAI